MAEYEVDTSQVPQQQQDRRTGYARIAARAPSAVATTVTQRSSTYSGKGILTVELLVGFAIVLIRLVGDVDLSGVQQTGSAKGNILHPRGQYGPVAILAGLVGSFFFLSLLAVKGGTPAKLAVILGGIIVTTLGVTSYPEIVKVGSVFGRIGTVTVPKASGQLPDIYGTAGTGSDPGLFNTNTPLQQVAAQDNNAVLFGLQGIIPPSQLGSLYQWVGNIPADLNNWKNNVLHLFGL